MNKYLFKGTGKPEDGAGLNLGRFGWVKPGDTLILTPREALSITADPRFEMYDPAKHSDITPPDDPAAEFAARIETLRQLDLEGLRGVAKENGITFGPRTSGARLLHMILAKVAPKNGGPALKDPDEEE